MNIFSELTLNEFKTKSLRALNTSSEGIGSDIYWLNETTSTNDAVWDKITKGANEGLVIFADYQSRGRGRFGTQWFSPPGMGILFSAALKQRTLTDQLINGVAALSVSDVCRSFGVSSLIKWPNDIYVNGKKICGILVEKKILNSETWSGVGVGLNVNNSTADLPPDISTITTSLKIESESTEDINTIAVADGIISGMRFYYGMICKGDADVFCEKWYNFLVIKDEKVIIKDTSGEPKGKITGITPDGFFAVQTLDNSIVHKSHDNLIVLTKEI